MALIHDRLLDLADALLTAPIHARAPCLVSGLDDDLTFEAAAALPLGQRNGRLLAAYETLFGPALDLAAHCPNCPELIVLLQPIAVLRSAEVEARPTTYRIGGRRLTLRPLNDGDLAAAAAIDSPRAASRLLAARALGLDAEREADALSETTVKAVARRLGQIDPLAELLLDLSCPNCKTCWSLPLDVPDLVTRELIDAAEVLLDEVHALASRYGWSQDRILALPASRRAAYLARVRP